MKKLAQTAHRFNDSSHECKNNDDSSYHKFQSWFLQRFLNLPAELLEAALRGQRSTKVHTCALENNDKNMREEINVRAVDQKHEYH